MLALQLSLVGQLVFDFIGQLSEWNWYRASLDAIKDARARKLHGYDGTRGPVISGKVSPLVPSLSCHVTSGLWSGPSHDFLGSRYSHESTSGTRFIAGQLLDIRAIKTPAWSFLQSFRFRYFLVKEAFIVNPLLIINRTSESSME